VTASSVKVVDLEPMSVSPKEAGRLLGVSRDHVYDLVNAEELESARSRGRILIDLQSLRDYYARIKTAS
jgi:excisionase family DNA binding protein